MEQQSPPSKRPGEPNLIIPSLILGIVLITFLSILASNGNPVVIQFPPTTPDDRVSSLWDWLERLSWLATFIGLPATAYQVWALRTEQRRQAEARSKSPVLEIGIGNNLSPSVRFRLTDPSGWTLFDLRIENNGTLVADNILVTIYVPVSVRHKDLFRITSDLMTMAFPRIAFLHPGTAHTFRLTMLFTKLNEDIPFQVSFAYTGSPVQNKVFHVGVYTDLKLARERPLPT